MLRVFRFNAGFGIGIAVLLAAAPSRARITWDLQPAGTGAWDWTITQHWTFNKADGPGPYDVKYHSLGADSADQNVSWASGGGGGAGIAAPECLEVTTHPGIQYGSSNPDTVIEARAASSHAWQVVNDDIASGTFTSHARFWINNSGGTMTFYTRVRSFNYTHNSEDFFITITRRDVSEAACTTNQTAIPWAKFTFSNGATSLTMSSFH